jgi:hypothetical protein
VSGASVLQGLLLYGVLGWKLSHLARAPRDVPLRWVVACLGCAAVAYPFGVAAQLQPASPATPSLMVVQDGFLLAMAYALDCFFLSSLLPAGTARQRAARRAFALTAAVAVMAVAAARTPRGTSMTDLSVPAVAVQYLALDVPLALFLIDAWRWARRSLRNATGALASGLHLTSAGLALMIIGMLPLTALTVLDWARQPHSAALLSAGGGLVILGILVFLGGICYPSARMRLAAMRMWARHRRVYYQLAPLWTELHRAFPQDALARVPSPGWRDAVSPWGVHRRYYRRLIECRDGLVRVSARMGPDDGQPLGSRLIAALDGAPTAGVPEQAVPLAIPDTAGLDADARELVALARQVTEARSRQSGDLRPGERTSNSRSAPRLLILWAPKITRSASSRQGCHSLWPAPGAGEGPESGPSAGSPSSARIRSMISCSVSRALADRPAARSATLVTPASWMAAR